MTPEFRYRISARLADGSAMKLHHLPARAEGVGTPTSSRFNLLEKCSKRTDRLIDSGSIFRRGPRLAASPCRIVGRPGARQCLVDRRHVIVNTSPRAGRDPDRRGCEGPGPNRQVAPAHDRVEVRPRGAESASVPDVPIERREALLAVAVDVLRELVARFLGRCEPGLEQGA